MSILSDHEIKEATKKKYLVISDFSEKCLQAASYDLRVGRKVLKTVKSGNPVVNLETEQVLQIGTGEFVEILTYEKLELPKNMCAHMGIRSYFTRKGIVPFSGLQVDPGFKGHIIISLFNTGPKTVVLKYGEPFCTVEFEKLERDVDEPYSGPYQNQNDFPSENIEFITQAKGITLFEVVDVMKSLKTDVKWIKWFMGILIAAIFVAIITRALYPVI